jgi:hypothetical protein
MGSVGSQLAGIGPHSLLFSHKVCITLFQRFSFLIDTTEFSLSISTSLHVHRPPAVTLSETPEEFHISSGLR